MGRSRAVIIQVQLAGALVCALMLGACASGPQTPATSSSAAAAEAAERALEPLPPMDAASWFAVRADGCEVPLARLRDFARHPATQIPVNLRVEFLAPTAGPGWCALAPIAQRPIRADSWAQNVSAATKKVAISFYAVEGAWSYTVFDSGTPVFAQEAHFGEPMLVGEADAGAAVLGIEAQALVAALSSATRPPAHIEFARHLGLRYPQAGSASLVDARISSSLKGDQPLPAAVLGAELKVGEDAVMPPLGVVFIKAKTPQNVGGEDVYVVVDGGNTLRVPAARAASLGMRALVAEAVASDLLGAIDDGPASFDDADTYDAERARRWLASLKRGDLKAIATSYRELCYARSQRSLTDIEGGLMDSARTWLADEISVVLKQQRDTVDDVLRSACQ